MRLRSGESYWTAADEPATSYPPLTRDLSCDVAIVGGGISGALLAYYLTQAGIGSVLVDRRPFATGSTAASTGLLQYEIDTSLIELTSLVGQADAVRAYQLCVRALHEFSQLVRDLNDPCGLTSKPSLYLANSQAEAQTLQEECAARQACGIDVSFLHEHAIAERFPFRRPGALWSPLAMEVDPYQLAKRLITHAVSRGMAAYTHTEIENYRFNSDGVTLETATRFRIRARKVAFATGYETPEFINLPEAKLHSTYAIVTQPLGDAPGWPRDYLLWETARPYLYARATSEGRVMIGGEDVPFKDPQTRDALLPKKIIALTQKFASLFPRIPIIPQFAWAGTFAETADGLPFIGSCPDFPHAYFALGYGGNGITFSLLAAEMIRDLFLGRQNADIRIFRFGR